VPVPLAHLAVDVVELAGEHDRVSDRDVGDLVGERPGGVEHPDAVFLGGLEVDPVRPDAPLGDDLQPGGRLDDPGGQLVVAGEDAVVGGEQVEQFGLVELLVDLGDVVRDAV
jgi:hypothetical protein